MESTFLAVVDQSLQVAVFGKKAEDLRIAPSEKSALVKTYRAESLTFAWVHGVRFEGACVHLPKPLLLILPGDGENPGGCCGFTAEQGFRMWVLPKSNPIVALTHDVGPADDIVRRAAARGLDIDSDFRIYDVHVDGGVVKGRVRAYLRIKLPGPFGSTIFDITVIDRNDAFSINLVPDLCIPVFSVAVATAQVCFHNNPNRICGEVVVGIDLPVVGHFGKTFTLACVTF